MQATRGSIQFLGRLSGAGTLACDGEAIGRATFEIDGFRTSGTFGKPREPVKET